MSELMLNVPLQTLFRANLDTHTHTHTHTHNRFTAILDFVQDYPGELTPERYIQEDKTNLDLLEQEIVLRKQKWKTRRCI